MPKKAYIKMTEDSVTQEVTLEDVKAKLQHYIEMTTHTGEQLSWDYAKAAFPYTIDEKNGTQDHWLVLKGNDSQYSRILFAAGKDENGSSVIQVVLPDGATHGDVAKGNEFCKFLGKELKADVQLFNGRIIHFELKK